MLIGSPIYLAVMVKRGVLPKPGDYGGGTAMTLNFTVRVESRPYGEAQIPYLTHLLNGATIGWFGLTQVSYVGMLASLLVFSVRVDAPNENRLGELRRTIMRTAECVGQTQVVYEPWLTRRDARDEALEYEEWKAGRMEI